MFGCSGGVSTGRPDKTFTEVGFKDWKYATGKDGILKGHAHKIAIVAWDEFRKQKLSVADRADKCKWKETSII